MIFLHLSRLVVILVNITNAQKVVLTGKDVWKKLEIDVSFNFSIFRRSPAGF